MGFVPVDMSVPSVPHQLPDPVKQEECCDLSTGSDVEITRSGKSVAVNVYLRNFRANANERLKIIRGEGEVSKCEGVKEIFVHYDRMTITGDHRDLAPYVAEAMLKEYTRKAKFRHLIIPSS